MSFDNLIDNNSIKNYKKLLQFSIKKGKKHTAETNFRKSLYYTAKKDNLKFWKKINSAINNTMPYINVKVSRKGARNVHVPIKITQKHSEFFSSSWLIEGAKKRGKKPYYINLTDEIIAAADKKSLSTKKKDELHQLAEENINRLKAKGRYTPSKNN